MKPKILYLSFVALIIVILISILISRESAKIQSLMEETKPQQIETQQESVFSDQTQQLYPVLDNRSAITLIKPYPKENPTPAQEKRINKRQQPERLSVSPTQSLAVSESEPDDQSVSGVTKIGKRPTEKEKQEMNARGIIMY